MQAAFLHFESKHITYLDFHDLKWRGSNTYKMSGWLFVFFMSYDLHHILLLLLLNDNNPVTELSNLTQWWSDNYLQLNWAEPNLYPCQGIWAGVQLQISRARYRQCTQFWSAHHCYTYSIWSIISFVFDLQLQSWNGVVKQMSFSRRPETWPRREGRRATQRAAVVANVAWSLM